MKLFTTFSNKLNYKDAHTVAHYEETSLG